MVALAIAGEPRFVLDRCELSATGPTYTLDTVRELQAAAARAPTGSCSSARTSTPACTPGAAGRNCCGRVMLAVADRPGSRRAEAPDVQRVPHRAVPLPMLDISATEIRARAAARGEPIDRSGAARGGTLYCPPPSLPQGRRRALNGHPQAATGHRRWARRREGPAHRGLQHRAPVAAVRARDHRSGTSNRQTKALAASVRDAVKAAGMPVLRTEGEDNGEWIIVDCGAAVAHIMQPAIRDYYRLEEIWGGKPVSMKMGGGRPRRVTGRRAAQPAPRRRRLRRAKAQRRQGRAKTAPAQEGARARQGPPPRSRPAAQARRSRGKHRAPATRARPAAQGRRRRKKAAAPARRRARKA